MCWKECTRTGRLLVELVIHYILPKCKIQNPELGELCPSTLNLKLLGCALCMVLNHSPEVVRIPRRCLMYDLPRRYSRGSRFVSRPKRVVDYLLSTQMLGWLSLLKIDHNHCQILTSSSYCVSTIFVCPVSFDASLNYLKIVCLFQFVFEDSIKGVKMSSVLLTKLICRRIFFCFSSFKLAFFF